MIIKKKMHRSKLDNNGFTILELIIASTIFAIMLLLVTRGIIEIGRVYYKGVVTSRTQETTRATVDDISRSIQLTGNNNVNYSYDPANPPAVGTTQAVCVGTTRYTFRLNTVFRTDNNHALWVDKITSPDNCTAPALNQTTPSDGNTDNTASGIAVRKELMARNMRLANFTVTQLGSPTLMSVNARVIFGEIDLSPDGLTCLPINAGGQYCSVSELNTVVKKRLD